MFRRALAFFCLPCGRETDSEDLRVIAVCDEGDDPVMISPEEYNVVRLQFRLGPGQEGEVPPRAHDTQKTPVSSDAADVNLEERPGLQDSQQEGRISGKVSDASVTSTAVVAPSAAEDGASSGGEEVEEATPPAVGRRRGCLRCWAERLGDRVVVRPQGRRGYRLNKY